MEPLLLVRFVGVEVTEIEGICTEVVTLEVRVPVSRAGDVDRNDTLRREVAAAIANALPGETP